MDRQLVEYLSAIAEDIDPVLLFNRVIGAPDPWQDELLRSDDPFVVILCSRQIGKSEGVCCFVAHYICTQSNKVAVIVCPSERQSREDLRRIVRWKDALGARAVRSTQTELELANGSRVICLPATSDTARGFTADVLVFDEGAFFPDRGAIISEVLPMRRSGGRVIIVSTPNGKNNAFAEFWFESKARKISARSVDIPRLRDKVDFDREFMPELRFRIEHLCSFDIGAGTPFFNIEAVEAAFVADVEALWSS